MLNKFFSWLRHFYHAACRGIIARFHGRFVFYGIQNSRSTIFLPEGFSWIPGWKDFVSRRNQSDTQTILDRFTEVDIPFSEFESDEFSTGKAKIYERIFEEDRELLNSMQREFVAESQTSPRISVPKSEGQPGFSVVIPFHSHFEFFKETLNSIGAAAQKWGQSSFELVVVNDDPAFSPGELESIVPSKIKDKTRVLDNETNIGICATLNRGVSAAKHEWVLHLDCDDLIVPTTFSVLESYVNRFPLVRYISSRMWDIDGQGKTLRARLRSESPAELFSQGMVAGHLKAIRKDAFEDFGPYFSEYEGCQDYEFALRASMFEPLLFIPDYLYKYRWHGGTQSVSQVKRQMDTALRIQFNYLFASGWLSGAPIHARIRFEGEHSSEWDEAFRSSASPFWKEKNVLVRMKRPLTERNRILFALFLFRKFMDPEVFFSKNEEEIDF